MSIYVGNLNYRATQEDITEIFKEYGAVKNVSLPMDRESDPPKPRGFAFVEMVSEEDEASAIEALDGAEWMGRSLKVNKARPRQPR